MYGRMLDRSALHKGGDDSKVMVDVGSGREEVVEQLQFSNGLTKTPKKY